MSVGCINNPERERQSERVSRVSRQNRVRGSGSGSADSLLRVSPRSNAVIA